MLSYSVDFKAPWELWNPLSKAVPGNFHWSGRHSKCNCLQDRANFHRSQASAGYRSDSTHKEYFIHHTYGQTMQYFFMSILEKMIMLQLCKSIKSRWKSVNEAFFLTGCRSLFAATSVCLCDMWQRIPKPGTSARTRKLCTPQTESTSLCHLRARLCAAKSYG